MALFKIFGNFPVSGESSPTPISAITNHQQGYCYFDVNTNKFYVDTTNNAAGFRQLNGIYYGVCSTVGATATKVVNIDGFGLTDGVSIIVRFQVTNTASVTDLCLNVSNTGAKHIQLSMSELLQEPSTLEAGKVYQFIYVKTEEGGIWLLVGTGTSKDGLIFKGTIGNVSDGATDLILPAVHYAGWSYRVVTAGTYDGHVCEVGDIIACWISDPDATVNNGTHWTVIQNNIDGAVIGPSSVTDGALAVFSGTSGKVIRTGSINNHSYTPSGTVSVSVSLSTQSKTVMTGVATAGTVPTHGADTFTQGTLPTFSSGTFGQGTLPSLTMSVTDEVLTFSWNAGTLPTHAADSFSQGTLPTYSQGTFSSGAMPTFNTGSVLSGTTVSSATGSFAGTSATLAHTLS